TLFEVTADGFTERLFARCEIEHIVDQLKRHAEIPCKFTELFFELCIRAARYSAEFGAGGEQAGRFAVDEFHAVGFADTDLADSVQLNQLAFHHELGEADQEIENMEIPFAKGSLKRLHVEPVAGEHAGMVAPLYVG